jgi:hypothetical protein
MYAELDENIEFAPLVLPSPSSKKKKTTAFATIVPTHQEKQRLFSNLSSMPDADVCVFYKNNKPGKDRISRRFSLRNKDYNPKFLLLNWYFGCVDIEASARLYCPQNKHCVNPYHIYPLIVEKNQQLPSKKEEKEFSPDKKRKRHQWEIEVEAAISKRLPKNETPATEIAANLDANIDDKDNEIFLNFHLPKDDI